MSAPISSFQNLYISQDMQSTRSHTFGQSERDIKGKGKAPLAKILNPPDEESDEEIEEADEDKRLIFAPDHCRQIDTVYAFQIAFTEVARASIRITPTGLVCHSVKCSNADSCCHIQFLLAQLSSRLPETTARDDISTYEQISSIGLENVCERLQFELRDGPEDTEATWQLRKFYSTSGSMRRTRSMIRQNSDRLHIVRDIMASLSRNMTDDFRNDIFDAPELLSPGAVLGDLEATISRHIFFDDDIFYRFKTLVPHNVRATDYFQKALRKAQDCLHALDDYCEYGPSMNGTFDLIWCADRLVELVQAISINIEQRQPLSSEAKLTAAQALVEILSMVINERNVEVYANINWQRRRVHGEQQRDRNLYVRLIRNPPGNYPADFVLAALQHLPEARPYIDQLEELLHTLGSKAWEAPNAYKDKLRDVIAQLRAVSPGFDSRVSSAEDVGIDPRPASTEPSAHVAGPSAIEAGSSKGKRAAGSIASKPSKRMR